MYTKKQLKRAFQSGAIVKENLLNKKTNKKHFDLEEQFQYFLDTILIKDNPVPSLDIDIMYDNWLNSDGIEGVERPEVLDFIMSVKLQLSRQNGVETNKEQPICTGLSEPRCKCINFCTVTGSDEDM
jgi:hypothetical protein